MKNRRDCHKMKNWWDCHKMKNWWDYHKWYVVCGTAILATVIYLIGNALGLFTPKPDLQIAYIGEATLPEDTAKALERGFASICGDFNGDGKAVVKLRQYVSDKQSQDALYYEYASDIGIIGDVADCESYLFLMDDPQKFQRGFHVLANMDGSCQEESDYSAEGKAVAWKDCPALAGMELGSYSAIVLGQEVSGSSQELLSGMYLGRRCFYTDETVDYLGECEKLWELLVP